MKLYAQIIVIQSRDKAEYEELFAHREEFSRQLKFDPDVNKQARKTIEYAWEIQKALFACDKGLTAIGHEELHREIYKIRLMQSHYLGDICLWEC